MYFVPGRSIGQTFKSICQAARMMLKVKISIFLKFSLDDGNFYRSRDTRSVEI
jgi:hypothetical protein